jgi:aspartate/methionine/tyrosine aminotransferase
MEYLNRYKDPEFARLCSAMDNAKMLEVCSTKLPQLAIPKILADQRYMPYRMAENQKIGLRSKVIASILGKIPQLNFNETYGAFYNTMIFKEGVLKRSQKLKIDNPEAKKLVEEWISADDVALDKQFVYYLLAAKGICVVPISSFCSDLQGFRVTLLEENEELLTRTFTTIREAIEEYMAS